MPGEYIDTNTPTRDSSTFSSTDDCGELWKSRPVQTSEALLHFDNSARFRELLFDGLRFVLRNAFLDALRSAIHQILGFFQTEAGDFAYCLDYIDFVSAHFLQDDGEFRLLFRRCRRSSRRSAAGHHH